MRINRILRANSWRQSLGEILLIVVGITIALAFESWRSDSQDRVEEQRLLQAFEEILQGDLQGLIAAESRMRGVEEELNVLLDHVTSEEPYDGQLNQNFRALWRFSEPILRAAPFEELKSSGLDLVTNESLRMDLLSLYEDLFPRLRLSAQTRKEFALETARPFLMEEYRQLDTLGWEPQDYDSLRKDGYLENLCRISLQMISILLRTFAETNDAISKILKTIEPEITQ